MNAEEIKIQKILESLHNQQVIAIRPFFGGQSDSWSGIVTTVVTTTEGPTFHLSKATEDSSILFKVTDITEVIKTNIPRGIKGIIRLKGPKDYCGNPCDAYPEIPGED